jgi:hypothetical protein
MVEGWSTRELHLWIFRFAAWESGPSSTVHGNRLERGTIAKADSAHILGETNDAFGKFRNWKSCQS